MDGFEILMILLFVITSFAAGYTSQKTNITDNCKDFQKLSVSGVIYDCKKVGQP